MKRTISSSNCISANDPITQQEALELIQSLEPNQNEMSSRGFFKFMLGAKCDQFGVVRETEKGYYDKPLSHYYIKSSHNSYLKGWLTFVGSLAGHHRRIINEN